jgi:hypothetical protein
MLTKAKIDSNHADIVKQLRSIPGVSVHSVAQLKNFCDIIVGVRGKNYLFEIKKDNKSKLTEGEEKFQKSWFGNVHTVSSCEQILKIIGL